MIIAKIFHILHRVTIAAVVAVVAFIAVIAFLNMDLFLDLLLLFLGTLLPYNL